MKKITEIKNKIYEMLEELKTEEVFKSVDKQIWGVDSLHDLKNKKFPCAILTNATSISSEVSTNKSNIRTYSLGVQLCFKINTKTDSNHIDEVVETVMDKFDEQITIPDSMSNLTLAFIEPAVTETYIVDGVKDTVFVDLILKVKNEVELSLG